MSNSPTISAINFTPKNTSTPINTPEKPKIYENGHRPVVGEGEERDFVREKANITFFFEKSINRWLQDERIDKAMSFYENVHGTHNGQMNGQLNGNGTNGKPNEIWYEYGCVWVLQKLGKGAWFIDFPKPINNACWNFFKPIAILLFIWKLFTENPYSGLW